jgi:hypothetical protein
MAQEEKKIKGVEWTHVADANVKYAFDNERRVGVERPTL